MSHSTKAAIRAAYLAGDLLPADLIAFHRATFGDARMEDGGGEPQQPEGISDEEWTALGDPGKRALVREREARTKAESDLAAVQSKQQPKPTPPPKQQGDQRHDQESPKGDVPADVAAIVQQAVAAAIKPFQEREEQRETQAAAQKIADALTGAAQGRLHDPSDALANVDLTTLTDGSGAPDAAKIKVALDELVERKPHLAARRFPGQDAFMGGSAGSNLSLDDKVKATLAKMQTSAGVKFADA
ncbi:MAG: hypothetical protein Q4F67_11665 [Propionibacteriaceae bacterium]|nr:hypothetical protein [Propionibacteriaceae bacterium]